jgi:hypothetical protein
MAPRDAALLISSTCTGSRRAEIDDGRLLQRNNGLRWQVVIRKHPKDFR